MIIEYCNSVILQEKDSDAITHTRVGSLAGTSIDFENKKIRKYHLLSFVHK